MSSSPAVRSAEHWFALYRRTYRMSLFTTVLNPVLFLAAMGIGLGSLVGSGTGQIDGVSYLDFLAPGLLAFTAMQTATGESTWPVMGGIKWNGDYLAMLATPLSVDDVLRGHLLFITARITQACSIYLLVMLAFGAMPSPWGVVALPVAVLSGVAFATPCVAFAATRENDNSFSALQRFVITPLFLFSGTFFPISQLPMALQPIAWLTPQWHGVEAARQLCLGTATVLETAGHCAYLSVWAVAGYVMARRTFTSRLRP
jgi:lipooligosaccharide transport system permease protein